MIPTTNRTGAMQVEGCFQLPEEIPGIFCIVYVLQYRTAFSLCKSLCIFKLQCSFFILLHIHSYMLVVESTTLVPML